ncbi:MAG: hypothetical protein LUF78_04305 [Clostridiales bacterium]|nr:hypothetical protein [Clostridiales bacterium]
MNYEDDKSTVVTNFKSSPVTIPENGAYVRLSGTIANMASQQSEEGDSYTGYKRPGGRKGKIEGCGGTGDAVKTIMEQVGAE